MIECFELANVGTYNSLGIKVDNLKPINFFYGANGCGKTIISNYLADITNSKFSGSTVKWRNNQPVKTLVYNKAFREKNFGLSEIPGIFTLGEATISERTAINEKRIELDKKKDQLEGNLKTLLDKNSTKINEDSKFTDKCWKIYIKHKDNFKSALIGSIGSKESFKSKLIQEHQKNDADLLDEKDLLKKAETLLGQKPSIYPLIIIDSNLDLKHFELDPIWNKIIIGKSDVDIASIIQKLGNNDWVNQGRQYVKNSNICPFCQQPTIDDILRKKLETYFDKSFLHDIDQVQKLNNEYKYHSEKLLSNLNNLVRDEKQNSNSKLSIDAYQMYLDKLENQIRANILSFQSKNDKASLKVEVIQTKEALTQLHLIVKEANKIINEHNELAKNYDISLSIFKKEVWRFLAEQIKSDSTDYLKESEKFNKAIDNIETNKKIKKEEINKLESDIKKLSHNITKVQPAIDEINRLLKAYGFINFKITPSNEPRAC